MKSRTRSMAIISIMSAMLGACVVPSSSGAAGAGRKSGARAVPASSDVHRSQAGRPNASVFSSAEMAAAFAKGKALVNKNGMRYLVSTGRRDLPGEAEVHSHYTDVLFITEGSATLVTDGRVVQGKTIAPGEIRGQSIEGGVSHTLEKGSLVVVPAGVPHWFRSVTSPVVDLVIKVRTK